MRRYVTLFNSPIGLFRFFGFLEGGSLIALLFIAMPLKYFVNIPMAVTIVGALHGVLFIIYILVVLYTTNKIRWSFKWFAASIMVAFIPFGNIVLDSRLQKAGIIETMESATQ